MTEQSIYFEGHEWSLDESAKSPRYIRHESKEDTESTFIYYHEQAQIARYDIRGQTARSIGYSLEDAEGNFSLEIKNAQTTVSIDRHPEFPYSLTSLNTEEDTVKIGYIYRDDVLKKISILFTGISPELSTELNEYDPGEDPQKLIKQFADLYETGSTIFSSNRAEWMQKEYSADEIAGYYEWMGQQADEKKDPEELSYGDVVLHYTDKVRTYLTGHSKELSVGTLEALTHELLQKLYTDLYINDDISTLDNPEVFETVIPEIITSQIKTHYSVIASEGTIEMVLKNPMSASDEVELNVEEFGRVYTYSLPQAEKISFSYVGEYDVVFNNTVNDYSVRVDTLEGSIEVSAPSNIDPKTLKETMQGKNWDSVLEMVKVISG